MVTGVLKLLESITEKYSYLSRSDELYHEIVVVCDAVHDFLLDLTVKLLTNLGQGDQSVSVLEIVMRIYYNLNYQDLHPKFEDKLKDWMMILKQIMTLPNTSQAIFNCKGAALDSILLYANKYKEEVEGPIKDFCQ